MNTEITPQAVTEHGAAKILKNKVQTLRNWRHLRKGPPYLKYGRNVRYLVGDLLDYMKAHRIDPESD